MIKFIESLGLYLWARTWDVADRTFKLAGWAVLIVGLFALSRKTPTGSIGTIAVLLSIAWLAALIVSLFDAGNALQDECAKHATLFKSWWVQLIVNTIVTLFIVFAVSNVLRQSIVEFARIIDVSIQGAIRPTDR